MKKKTLSLSILLILIALISFYFYNQSSIKKTPLIKKKTKQIVKEKNRGKTDKSFISKKIISGNYKQATYNTQKTALVFLDEEGHNLYIQKEIDDSPQLLLRAKGLNNNFGWSKNGEEIYFKEKTKDYKTLIKSINIETKEIITHTNLSPLTNLNSIKISDTIFYLDKKTLAVKAQYKDLNWEITKERGRYYNILVAPNNKLLIAHQGSNVHLFSTSGEFIRDLGNGIATDWHSNNKNLIGFLDESTDGHKTTNSDLYLFNINQNRPTKITNTIHIMEMWPTFKNSQEVIYNDANKEGLYSLQLKTL